MQPFTIEELQGFLTALKEAYTRAVTSGGVTSYTLKTGQGESTVHQASLAEITTQIQIYTGMLNELQEIESGSNISYMTDLGALS